MLQRPEKRKAPVAGAPFRSISDKACGHSADTLCCLRPQGLPVPPPILRKHWYRLHELLELSA